MNFENLVSNYFLFDEKNKTEFKQWLHLVLEESFQYFNIKKTDHLHGKLSPQDVSKLFQFQNIPLQPENINHVIEETFTQIVQNSVQVSHPNYIGHMTQICPTYMLICDFIISFLNQNLVKIETAMSATYVEWQTLTWLHKLIYDQSENFYNLILNHADSSLGNLCSGGTIANLTAMIVARNHAFPKLHQIGLYESYALAGCQKSVVLVSNRGHYSIKKAAAIMGIGEQNVITIPCENFTNKINISELNKLIEHLNFQKIKIICLVGVAGSTETGSIDDLNAMAEICKLHKIWFHVDAAWGGALLLSQMHKHLLNGIEHADSVTLDGHKFLFLTISHSVVLFKNQTSLNCVRHSANYILREGSVDLGRTSIEGSRRFDSFKLWFSFRILGQSGYELLLNNAIENGKIFCEMIKAHDDFEMTSAYSTCILTYRFIPKKIQNYLKNLTDTKKIIEMNLILNKINTEIQKKQRSNGKSFVSRTSLESFFPGQEIVVLRAIPFNPLTNAKVLAEILMEQFELGQNLINKEKIIDHHVIPS